MPYWYDLFTSEHGGGVMRLFPVPAGVETFTLDYYRRMVIPCSVTATGCSINVLNPVITTSSNFNGSTIGALVLNDPNIISGQVIASIDYYNQITLDTFPDATQSSQTVTIGGDNQLLDCPEDYVEGIIALATFHFLQNKTSGDRLKVWQAYASEELDRAKRNNAEDTPDSDMCFQPPYADSNPTMGPNDIRWADYWN
jgi:hypothetical protein